MSIYDGCSLRSGALQRMFNKVEVEPDERQGRLGIFGGKL